MNEQPLDLSSPYKGHTEDERVLLQFALPPTVIAVPVRLDYVELAVLIIH